jgi:hypothetical protein
MTQEHEPDDLVRLQERIAELEWQLRASNLHSTSFLTRAFAVWGHFVVAHLIIAILIIVPITLLSFWIAPR